MLQREEQQKPPLSTYVPHIVCIRASARETEEMLTHNMLRFV